MLIFKFGGASLKSKSRIQKVGEIVQHYSDHSLVIVVSAIDKTTNRLEEILDKVRRDEEYNELLTSLQSEHYSLIQNLSLDQENCRETVANLFRSLESRLKDRSYSFDEHYDRIVCYGELISSTIVHFYLESIGVKGRLFSAHDYIVTDNVHRDAKVHWEETRNRLANWDISQGKYTLIQGFIGSSSEDANPTTLGREGSDYTASILAHCLKAESVHIWKDVDGVFSADPKKFPDAILIPQMSYREAIEMSYYGAKVIHSKTIKPLQNEKIPLFVRPFGEINKDGTVISDVDVHFYPPIVVKETDQVLLRINPADLSFIAENHLSELFGLFDKYRVKVNLMKNTAVSFIVCFKYDGQRTENCIAVITEMFQVERSNNLELMTIRHFNEAILRRLMEGRKVWFREVYADTVQLVLEPVTQS